MIVIINDVYIDLRKLLINIFINTIIFINLQLKHIMLNEIIIYKKFKVINFLINLFDEY